MTERVLDLAEGAAYLHVRNEQLVIERDGAGEVTTPLAELAVLILAHPRVTCTQSVFALLLEKGGVLVACDRQYQPAGLLLPTAGHFSQTERFAAQAAASLPTRKRVWRQIVRAKLTAQAELLEELRGHDAGLRELRKTVRSGDPTNVEAQAARRYWPLLFDDPAFRRRRAGEDQNRLLNWGYAVLRAIVGRAICAAGLHPSLGLHHHNRYDAYCLADDLMEPYRPLVDAAVVEHVGAYGSDAPLDRAAKTALLEATTGRYQADGEARTVFDLAARTASSLAKLFLKQGTQVWHPRGLGRAGD